jgi:hypothetical protein
MTVENIELSRGLPVQPMLTFVLAPVNAIVCTLVLGGTMPVAKSGRWQV